MPRSGRSSCMPIRARRRQNSDALPPMLAGGTYILRGYGTDDRIVYGSGRVVASAALGAEAEKLFADERIAYAHVRSSTNNCYQCRIDRA